MSSREETRQINYQGEPSHTFRAKQNLTGIKLREVVTLFSQNNRALRIIKSLGDDRDDFCLLGCTHLSPVREMTYPPQLNSRNLLNAFYIPGTVLGAKDTKLSESISVFKEFIA